MKRHFGMKCFHWLRRGWEEASSLALTKSALHLATNNPVGAYKRKIGPEKGSLQILLQFSIHSNIPNSQTTKCLDVEKEERPRERQRADPAALVFNSPLAESTDSSAKATSLSDCSTPCRYRWQIEDVLKWFWSSCCHGQHYRPTRGSQQFFLLCNVFIIMALCKLAQRAKLK